VPGEHCSNSQSNSQSPTPGIERHPLPLEHPDWADGRCMPCSCKGLGPHAGPPHALHGAARGGGRCCGRPRLLSSFVMWAFSRAAGACVHACRAWRLLLLLHDCMPSLWVPVVTALLSAPEIAPQSPRVLSTCCLQTVQAPPRRAEEEQEVLDIEIVEGTAAEACSERDAVAHHLLFRKARVPQHVNWSRGATANVATNRVQVELEGVLHPHRP
jgi:hypothetical protein